MIVLGMYVEQNLMKGEIVLQKAKMSPVGAIVKWIFFVLFGIVLFYYIGKIC